MSDYYSILGVNKNSSQDEIKSAYRKLAREWHPDVNKTEGAEDKFKKINEFFGCCNGFIHLFYQCEFAIFYFHAVI